jgi:Cof subfamily protein (haloacid dehalogenase superfamily)
MSNPRLFVSDVDRTLLTHSHVLLQRVLDAFGVARDAGIAIVLATARSPEGVKPYAERLGLSDLAICFNGGWIGNVSSGLAISERRIDRTDALHAMTLAHEAGIRPMWFTGSVIYALSSDPIIAREAQVTGERLEIADTLDELPGEPGKIMCVAPEPSERSAFAMIRKRCERLSVSGSHPRLIEIGPRGVSKQAAVEVLAARLGIARDDCAAAGDAENDLEMLAWVGTAVTVGNAVPEAKRLASFVGPTCDEGGLADALAWLMRPHEAPSKNS